MKKIVKKIKKVVKKKKIKKEYKKVIVVDNKDCIKNMNMKVKPSDYKKIRDNADKYTNGCISTWARHVLVNYVPKGRELTKVEVKR